MTDTHETRSPLMPLIVLAGIVVLVVVAIVAGSHFMKVRELAKVEAAMEQMAATVPTQPPTAEVAELLEPLEGATAVRHDGGAFGSHLVAYLLVESYPADSAIQAISTRLENRGWTPLPDDWLNPGNPSSQVDGWGEFRDATRTPPRHVHQWMGQWQDAAGNIVHYTFQYSLPITGPPDLNTLSVDGSWYPKTGVDLMRTPKVH